MAGASQGEGLGNKFLAHIRETDAIAHVVRCFDHDDIVHVAGRINPISDIDVINTELALADLAVIDKAVDRAAKADQERRQGSRAPPRPAACGCARRSIRAARRAPCR